MANGYSTPMLTHITALTKGKDPAKKLSPLGFLSMILATQDDSVQMVNNTRDDMGHRRDLTVKYRRRRLEADVTDAAPDCDHGATPVYNEFGFPTWLQATDQLWIPDTLIRQYQKDTSEFVVLDGAVPVDIKKQTNAMKEVYGLLIESGGAVLRRINKRLVTAMATQFGVNTVTGNNATRPLSFSLGTTGMNDAMVQLIADWRENELQDGVTIVGNGPFANYDLIRQILSNQASSQGISQAALSNMIPKVYFDKDTKAIWGANQVGVFEKGSVFLLAQNDYQGNFRRTMANSDFFTMALPVNEYNGIPVENLDKLLFDIQVKEFDCAGQSMTINGVATTTDGPGVLVSITKKYNLFTKPTVIWNPADTLAGTNGTLRYTITATP